MAENKNKSSLIIKRELGNILGERFGRYAKYIIQERAIPDARDGLKPVQRRILFAMNELGLTWDKSYKKSARIVGEVIGKYHPHGDSSVYEAMVRMSQDWKTNAQLIDMHGNNGSIDDDPPAAMRYTEVRMSKISSFLLQDIEFKTVNFTNNFDDSEFEPTVLPAKFPNLLVNGARGIAAGYATEIPPHNLGEIIDAIIFMINKPAASIYDLLNIVKGPDFPTGGIIQGKSGIIDALSSGRGRISIKAKTEIINNNIIIHEMPFGVNKANMVRKIAEIILNQKINGIREIRDETSRQGLKVVIELQRDSDANTILKYLFKNSEMQVFYNYNMVVIDEAKPKLANLKELIQIYIKHQEVIVNKKSQFKLTNLEKRKHILDALIVVINNLDKVIELIRNSNGKSSAKESLMQHFQFDIQQAEAIVTLQLYRLSSTDIKTTETEYQKILKQIQVLQKILANRNLILKIIIKELENIKNQFANPRLSKIENHIDKYEINNQNLVKSEMVNINFTNNNYFIKYINQINNNKKASLKIDDVVVASFNINNKDVLYAFTNYGNILKIAIHKIKLTKNNDIGQHINEIIKLSHQEKIIKIFNLNNYNDNQTICFITIKGQIKNMNLNDLRNLKSQRLSRIIKIKNGDELRNVIIIEQKDNLVIVNDQGYYTNFPAQEVPILGANTSGVRAIKLKDDQNVIGISSVSFGSLLLIATNDGYYKKIDTTALKTTNRALRGNLLFKTKTNQKLIAAIEVNDFSKIKFQVLDGNWYKLENKINQIDDLESKKRSFSKKIVTNISIKNN